MKSIFIIAQHRTGSTLLKNILNTNSRVHMAFDEMNLYDPFKKNTLDKLIGNKIKSPSDLVEAINDKCIYGTFWKEFKNSGIDINKFKASLTDSVSFNEIEIIKHVLIHLKNHNPNIIPGVKYPIHFRKINKLISNFSECKIIFLTRNPLSMIASKLNDPSTKSRKKSPPFFSFFIHYFTLLYFIIEYNISWLFINKYKKHIHKVAFEDLVLDKKNTILKVCDFCDIEFEKKMLNAQGKSSSFKNRISENFTNHDYVNHYKNVLSNFDIKLINLLNLHKKFQ